MARIAGVDIPREKRTVVSLTYIYGIGPTLARQVCVQAGVDESTRLRDLTDEEVAKLRNYIEGNLRVEGDLRRETSQDVKRKMEMAATRGCATAGDFPCAASAPTPTLAPARARRRPLPARRR